MTPERAQVVVVGAGLAGLSATYELKQSGVDVLLLDARGRSGGRVSSDMLDGVPLELGGEFIGPTQNHVISLAKNLSLDLFETHNTGDIVFEPEPGQKTVFPGESGMIPPMKPDIAADVLRCVVEIDELSRSHAKSTLFADRIPSSLRGSFGEWLDTRSTTKLGRQLVEYVVRGLSSAECDQISLASVVRKLATAGDDNNPASVARVIATNQGAQMFRVRGGSHQLPDGLTNRLSEVIQYDTAVRSVTYENGVCRLDSDGRDPVVSEHVILAMSPSMTQRVHFGGDLAGTERRFSKWRAASCMKVLTVYEEPFWRSQGLSGAAISPNAVAESVYDNSPESGSCGVLLTFVKGRTAARLAGASDAVILKEVGRDLIRMFGPQAGRHKVYRIMHWSNDPWSGGCPCAYVADEEVDDNTIAAEQSMWRSAGNAHFAASEFSPYWSGYMDGAIWSGKRAARDVMEKI